MKKLLVIVAVLLVAALGFGYYMWNKPKKSAASEEVFTQKTATELYLEFSANPSGALQIYLQKNIEVSGVLESFAKDSVGTKIILKSDAPDGGVVSVSILDPNEELPVVGDSVRVKGLCAGFIEPEILSGEVQLNQGTIVK